MYEAEAATLAVVRASLAAPSVRAVERLAIWAEQATQSLFTNVTVPQPGSYLMEVDYLTKWAAGRSR